MRAFVSGWTGRRLNDRYVEPASLDNNSQVVNTDASMTGT
jgi:hypothetical protein